MCRRFNSGSTQFTLSVLNRRSCTASPSLAWACVPLIVGRVHGVVRSGGCLVLHCSSMAPCRIVPSKTPRRNQVSELACPKGPAARWWCRSGSQRSGWPSRALPDPPSDSAGHALHPSTSAQGCSLRGGTRPAGQRNGRSRLGGLVLRVAGESRSADLSSSSTPFKPASIPGCGRGSQGAGPRRPSSCSMAKRK